MQHRHASRFSLLASLTVAGVLAGAVHAGDLRISQVYGGGGSTSATATYNKDYVEIFNAGSTPITLTGYAIEYGSATGTWGSAATNYFVFPKGAVIQPCSYILVASTTASTGGAALPVTPDYSFTIAMSATNGKIGLFSALNANIACGSETAGTLVDKIAYGTATCAEGTAVAALSNSTGAVRNGDGMADTDSNIDDFAVVTAPVPHSSASAANPACGGGGGTPCPADFNGDGEVGAQDLAILLGAWGKASATYDLNGDGLVGAQDLAALLSSWGTCP